MKNIKHIIAALFISALAVSCTVDGISDDISSVQSVSSANANKIFDISQDNSGNVKITPTGEGFSKYLVQFGHGSGAAASAVVMPGQSAVHSYPEGNYTVTIISYDLAGKETTSTYPLTVKYVAPTNLAITADVSGYDVKVSSTADNANGYLVYFGDVVNEVGTSLANGASITHTYATAGSYNVKVIALSGGAATTTGTKPIVVYDSYSLPITYELTTQNYSIGGTFGGVDVAVVDNPFKTGINTSNKVWRYTKNVGAASWSGTWTPMSSPNAVPINIDNGSKIQVMVYSTEVGKQLNVELEQASSGISNQVLKQASTVANQWQVLTFDFGASGAIPAGTQFKQLVLRYNDSADGVGEVIYIDNVSQTN